MESFMSAIDWQGFKDIVIVLGAIFAIYLGFQMYEHAVDTTSSTQAEMRTHLVTISINGGGPGIASMFLGAAILIVALLMGRAVFRAEAGKCWVAGYCPTLKQNNRQPPAIQTRAV